MKVITSIDDAVASVGRNSASASGRRSTRTASTPSPMRPGITSGSTSTPSARRRESPYGTTIAHGFLTLSMIPALTKDNYRVENAKMAINYGSNKVRFIAAVPSGGRIRARSELIDATKVDDNTVNLTVKNTIELDGSPNQPRSPRRSCGCCS